MPPHAKDKLVTFESARIALMGMKRQSWPVDPDSKDMQAKYREMRQKFDRVSPAAFMKFLDTGKEMVSAGAKSSISYWVVPKTNFPKGLSPKLKAAEAGPDVFSENGSPDVDRDSYYVIDQCVPREALG